MEHQVLVSGVRGVRQCPHILPSSISSMQASFGACHTGFAICDCFLRSKQKSPCCNTPRADMDACR